MPKVGAVTPADPSPSTTPAEGPRPPSEDTVRPRRRLRAWLGEAPSRHSPPFSRYRWVRLLSYLVLAWAALAIALAGAVDVSETYGLAYPSPCSPRPSRRPPPSWPSGVPCPPGRCP